MLWFVLVIIPYVQLLINWQSPVRITNIDEDKLNNSWISEVNTSFNSRNGEFKGDIVNVIISRFNFIMRAIKNN